MSDGSADKAIAEGSYNVFDKAENRIQVLCELLWLEGVRTQIHFSCDPNPCCCYVCNFLGYFVSVIKFIM